MRNKLLLDLHTHTLASGHAYGTIRENAQAAREMGLAGLGLTEHAPGIPGTCDPIYFRNMQAIPRELYGVHIYFGTENNVLEDGTMTLPDRVLAMLDYNIVGIHGMCYRDQGIEKNTDNLIACMMNPRTFFVSHPDDSTWPLDYDRLVPAARKYGVALEVNNATVRENRRKNCLDNIRTYLQLCMRHGTRIIVSSDAHDPSEVGHFEAAEALLDAVGFDEDLIVNNSEQKFRAFIGLK